MRKKPEKIEIKPLGYKRYQEDVSIEKAYNHAINEWEAWLDYIFNLKPDVACEVRTMHRVVCEIVGDCAEPSPIGTSRRDGRWRGRDGRKN